MKKQQIKKKLFKFKKEWIELFLCDMIDEIFSLFNRNRSESEVMKAIMKAIKKYTNAIYRAKNNY